MEATPRVLAHNIEPEELARANFYALLSRLYGAAPDAAILGVIGSADELAVETKDSTEQDLARAWRELIAASAVMDPEAAAAEYQDLFIGVGQSAVSLHGSAYLKAASGKPFLVDIRNALARLGLARQAGVELYEDHLAAVCETMRLMIMGGGQSGPFAIERQREFFDNNVGAWVFACCDAIKAIAIANYYRRVAQLTDSFMALERDSFAIE